MSTVFHVLLGSVESLFDSVRLICKNRAINCRVVLHVRDQRIADPLFPSPRSSLSLGRGRNDVPGSLSGFYLPPPPSHLLPPLSPFFFLVLKKEGEEDRTNPDSDSEVVGIADFSSPTVGLTEEGKRPVPPSSARERVEGPSGSRQRLSRTRNPTGQSKLKE